MDSKRFLKYEYPEGWSIELVKETSVGVIMELTYCPEGYEDKLDEVRNTFTLDYAKGIREMTVMGPVLNIHSDHSGKILYHLRCKFNEAEHHVKRAHLLEWTDDIDGIGEVTTGDLYDAYGSLSAIQEADRDELMQFNYVGEDNVDQLQGAS